ncbi:acetoacetate--CoA ligase [Nocardia vinacea]|uniref:acetoacetate--CoA ligase n=1 Tax=Nocardia vinacea TaxID=96468 RepID=UPI0002E515E4|nr:acetoacetate--CoA ligase [Nocardia vinacea]
MNTPDKVDSPRPQWIPTDRDISEARITDFAKFATARTGVEFPDYAALWQWSVEDVPGFWTTIWQYFDLGTYPGTALSQAEMPGAQWFPDVRLNYVDRILRQARTDRPAIVSIDENGTTTPMTWDEMLSRTSALAAKLRSLGVRTGDRVVGYLPNIPEAVIAFLATSSVGAVWSACGQDYSAKAALDRLGQLRPVVLVTADGYRYGGKSHNKIADIAELRAGLPELRATVVVSTIEETVPDALDWQDITRNGGRLETDQVSFDHPLWILYSSGTTGLPKGIVHGHGGVLLEHLKAIALQSDIGPQDTFFWYTSPSWMMWNYQIAGLLVGATIVCYAGSPAHPRPDALWEMAASTRATVLGTSPGYILGCMKAGVAPGEDHDLSTLRSIGITGAALPASSSIWLRDNVGARIQVASISGGTDVVSAFIGAVRTVPVWPGEVSAPFLGVALDAWDQHGSPAHGDVGELVIKKPMPSMPVAFWNDPDGSRYRSAYFEMYPTVWRHGDWITITDRGSIIVHGRSDSTLNRNGIRMGSADIYQVVEHIPEISEALVIGAEQPDGGYWMPLFVVPAPGCEFSPDLVERINTEIRTKLSPRHVPDEIIAAPGVPHTRTGKKLEVPIKRLLQGADPARVVDRSAVDHPTLLDWYARLHLRESVRERRSHPVKRAE